MTDPFNKTRSVVSASITEPQPIDEPDYLVGTVVLGGMSWQMLRQVKASAKA